MSFQNINTGTINDQPVISTTGVTLQNAVLDSLQYVPFWINGVGFTSTLNTNSGLQFNPARSTLYLKAPPTLSARTVPIVQTTTFANDPGNQNIALTADDIADGILVNQCNTSPVTWTVPLAADLFTTFNPRTFGEIYYCEALNDSASVFQLADSADVNVIGQVSPQDGGQMAFKYLGAGAWECYVF